MSKREALGIAVLLAGLLLAGCERAPLGYDAMALGPIELELGTDRHAGRDAEQPLPRHTGRRVGKLTVVVASDGALSGELWTSTAMGPEVSDDPAMKNLLEEYRE